MSESSNQFSPVFLPMWFEPEMMQSPFLQLTCKNETVYRSACSGDSGGPLYYKDDEGHAPETPRLHDHDKQGTSPETIGRKDRCQRAFLLSSTGQIKNCTGHLTVQYAGLASLQQVS